MIDPDISSKPLQPLNTDDAALQAMARAAVILPTLLRKFPFLDQDAVRVAVDQATLDCLNAFQIVGTIPSRRALYLMAWRNCANAAASEKKRRIRDAAWYDACFKDQLRATAGVNEARTAGLAELVYSLLPTAGCAQPLSFGSMASALSKRTPMHLAFAR